MKEELLARLRPAGQEHLLAFWDELEEGARQRLAEQIRGLDLELIARLVHGEQAETNWAELALRAAPPPAFRSNRSEGSPTAAQARAAGEAALAEGRLGVILVAGGQGSRLGFEHPKGLFPLGPLSQRTIFQMLIERLLAVGRRYAVGIPLYLMTSPATHEETVNFLAEQQRFGLEPEDLHVFCQGTMPAADAGTGRLLLAERDQLFLAPDGHGGMLAAFARSGCLADAQRRGIEHLFYGQVDNPLLQICDPELIGYHLASGSEMTSQAVEKQDPLEKVGVFATLDGRLQVLEYSDLPDEVARQRNADGSLRLWAGSIAVHVFGRSFLERMSHQADALPFHRALKKTPYLDEQGRRIEPEEPNAIKFERFIFDLLPQADDAVVVEVDKNQAFAPVKNADGAPADTPQAARQALIALHTQWLRQAGAHIDEGVAVEINPLWALDADEVARKTQPGLHITQPTYFH